MKSHLRPLTAVLLALGVMAACPNFLPAQAVQPTAPPWRWLWIGSANPLDTWGSPNSLNGGALTGNFLLFPNNVPNPPIFRPHTGSDLVVIDPAQSSIGTLGETITGTASCRIEASGFYTIGRLVMGAGTTLSLGQFSGLRLTTVPEVGYPSFNGSSSISCDGDIRLESPTGDSLLRIAAATTIDGAGTITMVDATVAGAFSLSNVSADTQGLDFTVGPAFTIRGAGAVGYSGAMNITNNGAITATSASHPLYVFLSNLTGSNLTNHGVLSATAGATLEFNTFSSSATIFNASGSIQALTGSTVRLGAGTTVSGGMIATAGTGVIRPYNGTLLNVTSTGAVAIGNAEIMRLAGTFTNNGSVNFDSAVAGSGGYFFLNGNVTLAGPGTITLKVENQDVITALAPSTTLTNSASHTIRGAGRITALGQIGLEATFFFTLSNAGLVDANVAGKQLVITLRDVDGGRVTNTGTMRASNGGELYFNGNSGLGTVTNTNGRIEALDGSKLTIGNNSIITGGTLATTGTGVIRGGNAGGTLTNVTNTGVIKIGFAESVRLGGTFTNNGAVTFDSTLAGGGGNLYFDEDVTLAGTGSVTMTTEVYDNIGALSLNRTLTNAASHTIKGAGVMGPGLVFHAFVNAGLVDANVPGKSFTFITRDSSNGTITNTGTIRASNGGTLNLTSNSGAGTVTNTGGRIEALNGSIVNVMSGVIVNGGMISASGTGVVRGGLLGSFGGGTFANLTCTGNFDPTLSNISGVVSNAGTLTLPSTSGATLLPGATFNNLAGANIVLSNTGAFTGSGAFNNAGTLTMSGAGQAAFTGLAFTNSGTVAVNTGALAFQTFAQSAGTLQFTGGTSASVASGQAFQFQGGAIAGNGTLSGNVANVGSLTLGSTNATTSAINITGNYSQSGGATLNLNIGGLTAGAFGMLNVSGTATLAGSVQVNLVNGFKFRVGDTFQIVGAGSTIGAFGGITLPSGVQGTLSSSGGNVTLTITAAPPAASLGNISTRGRIETVDNVMIGGFIIGGTTSKRVIIRALGPTLTTLGVVGALSNPTLTLFNPQGQPMATNDNWRSTQEAEIVASTLAPPDDRESAIIATLAPGPYTAIVSGVGGEMGVGIVEVYDLDLPSVTTSRPINVSTRGRVSTGDGVMIGGFIIEGTRERRVIIRAIGPSLTPFGVQGALADPTLTLYDPQGQPIVSNDNWKDTQQAAIVATGRAPSLDAESAIVITLNPGPYTAIVRGKNGTTGVGLVEIYDLE